MGKNGASSWLAAVKRAFTSPINHHHFHSQNTTRKRGDPLPQPQDHQQKKREKRRWLFRKSIHNVSLTHEEQVTIPTVPPEAYNEKQAISVAEAAMATANAAVEIIRLTRTSSILVDQHYAAIAIQTAFRAYLARKALRALRGIVTLQALVRGQNVRRQAKMTLKCMQGLLRVQARLRDQQRPRDVVRKSMFAETTTNLWESKYLQDIRQRKSTSGEERCMGDDWDEVPQTLEVLDAILKSRKGGTIKREKSLAYAFSQQFDSHMKISRNPSSGDEKGLEGSNWQDHGGMATKQRERLGSSSRASFDIREPIKTLEVDMSRPYSNSPASNLHHKTPYINQQYYCANSPHHRSSSYNVQPPVTPSPSKTRPLHVRSPSPRCPSYSNANTPNLHSSGRFNASMCRYSSCANDVALPNYMAATESARARVRPQSAPRQRPSTPERERSGSVKKRLAYPFPEPCDEMSDKDNYLSYSQNLRSPSFKSVQVGHVGMGNLSCYADSSIGGEISPCSTTELRRWFR